MSREGEGKEKEGKRYEKGKEIECLAKGREGKGRQK